MADSPMKTHPLGLAARYNDADCEEVGLEATIEKMGLDLDSLMYLSEQRGLRVVLQTRGQADIAKSPRMEVILLSSAERAMLIFYQSLVFDGIAIGWRGHKISQHEVGYMQPTKGDAVDLICGILNDFSPEDAKSILAQVQVKDGA